MPGQRIDEDVPISVGEITLMKMDIDGPDSAAMRGAEKLFEQKLVKCVHFVSIDQASTTGRQVCQYGVLNSKAGPRPRLFALDGPPRISDFPPGLLSEVGNRRK